MWEIEAKMDEMKKGNDKIRANSKFQEENQDLHKKRKDFELYMYQEKQRVNTRINQLEETRKQFETKKAKFFKREEEFKKKYELAKLEFDKRTNQEQKIKTQNNEKVNAIKTLMEKAKKDINEMNEEKKLFKEYLISKKKELRVEKHKVNTRIGMIEKQRKLKRKAEIIAEKEKRLSTHPKTVNNTFDFGENNKKDIIETIPESDVGPYEGPIIANTQFEEFQRRELTLRMKLREIAIEKKITEENKLRLDASRQRLEVSKMRVKSKEDQLDYMKEKITEKYKQELTTPVKEYSTPSCSKNNKRTYPLTTF
eukprot:UN32309